MRRVILLALLAVALPTAALASSIDFNLNGGFLTVGSTSASVSTNVTGICFDACNTVSPTTGSASIILPSFATGASTPFGSGGSISLTTAGGYVFNGTFSSGNWIVTTFSGKTGYQFTGVATGTLTLNGSSITTTLVLSTGQTSLCKSPLGKCGFQSGDITIGTVPEPGTLGLLGTGLIGLAGIVRKKLRG